MTDEDFKKLAIKYFDGRSSVEDESILMTFIDAEMENKTLFENWEKEWVKLHRCSIDAQIDWNTFIQKKNQSKSIFVWKKLSHFNSLKYIIAVAAGCFIIGWGIAYVLSLRTNENNMFIVEAPMGEKSKVFLPDGTIVWLNAGSTLSCNGDFNTRYRIVNLCGEGFFEVSKNAKPPFIVKTSKYDIVVKGTKFNISSYSEDNHITTSLMEGEIELVYKNERFKMTPGEIVRLDIDKDILIKTSGRISRFKSWTENKIEYDAIALSELIRKLSRQYKVSIHLEAQEFSDKILTVSLNNRESIEEIMKSIEKVIPVEIYYENEGVYIRNK